jgi:uncharacterized membrane protein YphA (DoxX/SURF4 family)
MNAWTKFFLILLRIAIGWHLLFAGLAKFAPDYRGSEGYLQEATGPVAPYFHGMIGDKVADRYAVLPVAEGNDPASVSHAKRCPVALAREWDSYCNEFIAHYHLDEEVHDTYSPANFAASTTGLLAAENGGILVVAGLDQPRILRAGLPDGGDKSKLQKDYCDKTVENFKAATVVWMLYGSKPQRFTSPWGPPVEAERTPEQRVRDYVAQRERIRKAQAGELAFGLNTLFGADKTKDLLAEKGEVSRTRADLARELDTRTSRLKEALRDVLTPEQAQKYGPMPEPVKATGVTAMSRLEWIDFMVRWGLVLSGAGLILGLFTRSSCVLGAALLLSFYLAAMPLPGVLEAVRVEGYPYVNKNIVEMLALLTLATTASGRWAGLDALNPFNWRSAKPKAPPPPPDRYNGTVVKGPAPAAIPSHVPSRR